MIGWMPERPEVSAAQLSVLPTPSEVTTPMPVTATTGLPRWSLVRHDLFLYAYARMTSAVPSKR